MTATALQQVSNEDIKQAILDLIRENNAEFKQFLGDVLPKPQSNNAKKAPKKSVEKSAIQDEQAVRKERVPYSEMPFWKANPHLKPRVPEGKGITMDVIKQLQVLFQEPDCPPIEEWIAQLD
jgi:hypothetical protein